MADTLLAKTEARQKTIRFLAVAKTLKVYNQIDHA